VKVHPVEIRQAEELDDAIVRAQAKGLIVFADPLTFSHRQRIVQTASQRGLATASGAREFVGAGGVLSYGPSFPEMFRHAAMYVDKLLNGDQGGRASCRTAHEIRAGAQPQDRWDSPCPRHFWGERIKS